MDDPPALGLSLTRALRVLWALEEMGEPSEIVGLDLWAAPRARDTLQVR